MGMLMKAFTQAEENFVVSTWGDRSFNIGSARSLRAATLALAWSRPGAFLWRMSSWMVSTSQKMPSTSCLRASGLESEHALQTASIIKIRALQEGFIIVCVLLVRQLN